MTRQHCRQSAFLLIVFLGMLSLSNIVNARHGVDISFAELQKEPEQGYALTARINYLLSKPANEALQNGVTLTMDVTFRIKQDRRWVWNKSIVSTKLTYRLRYRTLTRTYQVIDVNNGSQNNYSSLDAAVRSMGDLKQIQLDFDPLQPGTSGLVAGLKAELNIEALPISMRPLAYITPEWYHSSDWYTWPIQP